MGNLSRRASAKCHESRVESFCTRKETETDSVARSVRPVALGFVLSTSMDLLSGSGGLGGSAESVVIVVADDDTLKCALLELQLTVEATNSALPRTVTKRWRWPWRRSGTVAQLLVLDIVIGGPLRTKLCRRDWDAGVVGNVAVCTSVGEP
jgi:hypothetical protein